MMFVCNDCGEIFEKPKVIGRGPDRGDVCPHCESWDYDEAVQCDVCGEWFSEDDLYGWDSHVCRGCIDEHKYDLPTLLKSVDAVDTVEVPALATYIMSEREIQELIERELMRRFERTKDRLFPSTLEVEGVENYIDDYKLDLADYITKETEA